VNAGISDVVFEDDAFTQDDDGKSECSLPNSIIQNWIQRGKGKNFYDKQEDSLLIINRKTVVVTDYDPGTDTWQVLDVFRTQNPGKQGLDRFSMVDPCDFKESRREG
jgi:hypothetical protein